MPRFSSLPLAFLVSASVAQATDLKAVWNAAQSRDPAYLASQIEQAAAIPRRQQARALWNPTVSLDAFGGLRGFESSTRGAYFSGLGMSSDNARFDQSIYLGPSGQAAITATVPLVDRSRRASSEQLEIQATMADTQARLARQQLISLVSQRYLGVLSAREQLDALTEQERAIEGALKELERRRAMRDVSALDVQEAAERLGLVRASRASADSFLRVAKALLEDLHGPIHTAFIPLAKGVVAHPLKQSIERHIEVMRLQHPQIELFGHKRQIAVWEIDKHGQAQEAMQVSAIGQARLDWTSGPGTHGHASQFGAEQRVGVQVSIPISSGGFRSAKQLEALQAVEIISAEQSQVSLELEQRIRSAWHAIDVAGQRLPLLEETQRLSASRRDQTRRAHADGSRSTLERLMAELSAIDAAHALKMERLAIAHARLGLASASGMLSESFLQELHRLLHER
jgi:outer membrane protein